MKMCGHALVSKNLIRHLVEEIKKGEITPADAAVELSRLCECGVFNPVRAESLLRALTE